MDTTFEQGQEPEGALDQLEGIAALLTMYQNELQGVRFPGVDAATLAAGRAQVITAAREVERCAAQLEAAREAQRRAREALVATGRRAQAYARVYAEDQPALRERVESVTLPRALDGAEEGGGEPVAATAPARRRGRPPKSATAPSPVLFGESARASEPVPAPASPSTSAPTPATASAAATPAA